MLRFTVFCLIFVLGLPVPGEAQEQQPVDLTELSLEELMDLTVVSVNVLGVHTHFAREWMVSYKPMFMSMSGLLDGTREVTPEDVLSEFMVTPLDMTMEMHMLGLMYAPSDRVSLMAMAPYAEKSMNHVTRMGGRFTTDTNGLSDVKAGVLYTFYDRGPTRLLFTGLVSAPTGSIDERGATPMGPNVKLPYPMQLGSGTWDLLPGISYLAETEKWGWGVETGATIRLGTNDNDYTLGDRYSLRGYGSRALSQTVSATVGLNWLSWGNISGADPELNPRVVPTADPNLQGGERLDLEAGLTFLVIRGPGSQGLRLAVEGGVPIYQSLDGPQLETDWILAGAVQWTWSF